MRISDWSSDVCSSDLMAEQRLQLERIDVAARRPPAPVAFVLPVAQQVLQTGIERLDGQAALAGGLGIVAHGREPARIAEVGGPSGRPSAQSLLAAGQQIPAPGREPPA